MTKPKTIEIVSYDGKYPNLCSGRLTLKVGGKEYVTQPGVLCVGDGAGCYGNSDGSYTVAVGDWCVAISCRRKSGAMQHGLRPPLVRRVSKGRAAAAAFRRMA